VTLPALADSLPAVLPRERLAPGEIACKLAPGCPFVGPWADYLAHAPVHPLPHPHDRAAWLDSRRTFLGASEVAAVVGANPYAGPLECWSAKISPRPESPFTPRPVEGGGLVVVPSTEVGNLLERHLLDDFARRHGVTYYQPATARHQLLLWMGATPDAVLSDGRLCQVKVVGWRVAPDWEEGPPVYVLMQVQTEMEVWGCEVCVVLALVGSEIREYTIYRDPEMMEPLITICGDFWSYVERAEVPIDFDLRSTRADTLRHLWPEASGPVIPASEELRKAARAYAEAREQAKIAEEDKEAIGVQIAAMLGDHVGATWGRSKVTRVERAQRIDWKKYALSLGGSESEAEKFRPPPQRTLDVRIKGE